MSTPKTPGARPRRVDGSSIAASTSRTALLGALPSRTVQPPPDWTVRPKRKDAAMTKVHRNAQRTNRVRRGGMPFHQLLNSRRVLPVPEAVDGKERCPVCRNVASLTTRGYLRRHRDLFGHDCHNVARDTSTT